MKKRFVGRFLIVCVLLLVSGVMAAERDVKTERKVIRAEDGLELVCEARGKGETALVFLHGWSGDRQYWKNQVDEFAADYRVVAYDQAGHSESGKKRERWTVSGLADDVVSVAKGLGLKRMILVGHSMGGPVALMAAKRLPGKVVAVVAVDTLQNAEFKRPEEMTKKFLADFAADYEGTMRVTFPGLLHEKTAPELKDWLLRKAEGQDRTMALGLMRDLTALDLKSVFKEATVPIRAINSSGGYSFFIPTEVEINKKYADYRAIFMEGVGHYPMLEKPREFNQKLSEVLKEFRK